MGQTIGGAVAVDEVDGDVDVDAGFAVVFEMA